MTARLSTPKNVAAESAKELIMKSHHEVPAHPHGHEHPHEHKHHVHHMKEHHAGGHVHHHHHYGKHAAGHHKHHEIVEHLHKHQESK